MAMNFTNNAIMPLYVTHAGCGAETIGLFMGALSLSAVLGRPLIGIIIDRWGTKSVLITGSFLMAVTPLGFFALLDSGLTPLTWVFRLIQGLGYGAHFSAFFTYAAQSAPPDRRNEFVAKFGLSGMIAQMIGPYLGECLVEGPGFGAFLVTQFSFGALSFILALLLPVSQFQETTEIASTSALPTRWNKNNLILVLLLAIFMSICYSSAPSFIAPLAKERGIAGFGLFFTGFSFAGITIRLTGSHWGDRIGLRRVLVPAFFLYGISLFLLSLSRELSLMIIAGIFAGFGHGIAFPAVTTLGYNLASSRHSGRAMALTTGMMDGGAALTAFGLGLVAGKWGFPAVFRAAALFPILAITVILIHVFKNPAPVKPSHNSL